MESSCQATGTARRRVSARHICAALVAAAIGAPPARAEDARVDAPPVAPPSSEIVVQWHGPNAPGDFLAIAAPTAPAASFLAYARTSAGSPTTIIAPEIGEYEIRYASAGSPSVLARAPLSVSAVAVSAMVAPAEVDPGEPIAVSVAEPGDPVDYITIVAPGAADDTFGPDARLKGSSEVSLDAPSAPGDYEIRHVRARGQTVLARAPLKVAPRGATAASPEPTTAAPSEVVTPSSAAQPALAEPAATTVATAEAEPAPRPFPATTVPSVSLMALLAVDRASAFRVAWNGPDAEGDWLGVVASEEAAAAALARQPVGAGPARLTAPATAGDYEILYVDGASGSVLARRALEVR